LQGKAFEDRTAAEALTNPVHCSLGRAGPRVLRLDQVWCVSSVQGQESGDAYANEPKACAVGFACEQVAAGCKDAVGERRWLIE
jgi:hypothetical protein